MVSYGACAFRGGLVVWMAYDAQYVSLSLALQWHLWAPHVHGSSHVEIMFP